MAFWLAAFSLSFSSEGTLISPLNEPLAPEMDALPPFAPFALAVTPSLLTLPEADEPFELLTSPLAPSLLTVPDALLPFLPSTVLVAPSLLIVVEALP